MCNVNRRSYTIFVCVPVDDCSCQSVCTCFKQKISQLRPILSASSRLLSIHHHLHYLRIAVFISATDEEIIQSDPWLSQRALQCGLDAIPTLLFKHCSSVLALITIRIIRMVMGASRSVLPSTQALCHYFSFQEPSLDEENLSNCRL